MKMSATKTKALTRAEACAELAQRLGYTMVQMDGYWHMLAPDGSKSTGYKSEVNAREFFMPAFFNSRDAAAELVTYLLHRITDERQERFIENLDKQLRPYEPDIRKTPTASDLCLLLAATPEQITLAACKALNIEVE